jgi:hypothetical protein
VNITSFQDMRAGFLLFYNKRLSESRASEQNQEKPMGAGWTAYSVIAAMKKIADNRATCAFPVRPGGKT